MNTSNSKCQAGLATQQLYDLLYTPPTKLMLLAGCSPVTTVIAESAPVWKLVVANAWVIVGMYRILRRLKCMRIRDVKMRLQQDGCYKTITANEAAIDVYPDSLAYFLPPPITIASEPLTLLLIAVFTDDLSLGAVT
ncbi:hypothetical protein ANCDUO_04099 [Ancylostoma duodenale]|uniref:Uncharacterized protein n=1 Tax=Ancylostoma duodenale TaxID=51022 RepID=A0A0C2D7F2_9BILA|nr:hypothetical protein ANCDUO_04099 [Ancylostoma duodenale]